MNDEHVREACAAAWDAGWEAGYRDHLRWMRADSDDAATGNPHRGSGQ